MARVYPEGNRIFMEDILEETGWGLYYRVLIGVVSACSFCQAAAFAAFVFALPLGTCDSFLNETTILTVDMCFLLGRAIGGLLLNISSDVVGRMWLLPNSLMIIFCSTFLGAFSHGGTTLCIAMFILGSGLEASMRATRIHLGEFLPKNRRGYYLTIPSLFWTFGYMSMIGASWKLSYHAIVDHRGTDMRLTAWRLLFAMAGGCNIIVACVTAIVQPSPRYHLFRRQYTSAQSSLKLCYAINKSKYSETWPHREQDIVGIISDFQINTEPEPLNCTEQIRLLLRRMFKTVCLLFKRRFILTTASLISMRILLFSGIVPAHVLLSKSLTGKNDSCMIAGNELLHLLSPVSRDCVVDVDMATFLDFIVLALCIGFGQIIVMLMVDKFGRRFMIGIGLLITSLSAFSIAYWEMHLMLWKEANIYVKAVLSSTCLVGYSIFMHALDILEIEAFPTAARGSAAGVFNFYPNLVLCVVCFFWYMSCHLTYICFGFITCVAAFFIYGLPELKKRPMVE